MKINEIGYDEDLTDSLVNSNDTNVLNAARRLMYAVAGTKLEPKALFKKLFGKQMTTVNYSQRNWIWTFATDADEAWVWPLISTRGIAWEYHRKSDPTALLSLIEEIIVAVAGPKPWCPIHGETDVGARWSKEDGYHWRCEVGGISEEDTGWTCVHQNLGPANKNDYEAQWGEVAVYRPGGTAMGAVLKTQDGRATAHPYLLVQEKVRDHGFDPDYADKFTWYDAENPEYLVDGTEPDPGGNYEKVYYQERWEFVQAFLTEVAARSYIKNNGHRHRGELRTYVESAHRNPEIQMIRRVFMEAN